MNCQSNTLINTYCDHDDFSSASINHPPTSHVNIIPRNSSSNQQLSSIVNEDLFSSSQNRRTNNQISSLIQSQTKPSRVVIFGEKGGIALGFNIEWNEIWSENPFFSVFWQHFCVGREFLNGACPLLGFSFLVFYITTRSLSFLSHHFPDFLLFYYYWKIYRNLELQWLSIEKERSGIFIHFIKRRFVFFLSCFSFLLFHQFINSLFSFSLGTLPNLTTIQLKFFLSQRSVTFITNWFISLSFLLDFVISQLNLFPLWEMSWNQIHYPILVSKIFHILIQIFHILLFQYSYPFQIFFLIVANIDLSCNNLGDGGVSTFRFDSIQF